MKKIAVLLLFAVSLWADDWAQWRSSTRLWLEEGYLPFDREKLCGEDSLSSVIHCSDDNAIAYYSTLDSDYVVFVYAWGIGIWGVHEELTESYPYQTTLAQILEYEWMELWRWGLMDISEDSASTLISRILSEMSCSFDSGAVFNQWSGIYTWETSRSGARYGRLLWNPHYRRWLPSPCSPFLTFAGT